MIRYSQVESKGLDYVVSENFLHSPNNLRHSHTVTLMALMMFLVPAVGAPMDELLQDTLKSFLVSFFALVASFSFFWVQPERKGVMRFHAVLLFPVIFMAYALGSMAWSHTYLGAVEAIRWFVFALLVFLGSNTLTMSRVNYLAGGVHFGAVVASLWAALQFWFDFDFFPQFASPASTFINRNFFAEFLICTLPFSFYLVSRLRKKAVIFPLFFSIGFNIVALMMTGTRSALVGLMMLCLLIPVIIALYWKRSAIANWRVSHRVILVAVLLATVWGLGSINTTNPKLMAEFGQGDAIDRALNRGLSLTKADEYRDGSASVRILMWKATWKMIVANPVVGVGAGAWEVQAPLYQESGSQVETDFYAHNEILQLLAEYGLVGWLGLVCLLTYLLWAAHRTWKDLSEHGRREAPLRAFTLSSLLVLLIVSNAGFPWHLASTGALFALSLAVLAASDMRLGVGQAVLWNVVQWRARTGYSILCVIGIFAVLALYIGQQAAVCEAKLVRAYKMARTISQSGRPDAPHWESDKAEIPRLVFEAIAINPHYRRITPLIADELAILGDWKNATWIWKSVLDSRPHVVAIMANLSRGYLALGNHEAAISYFNRAQKLQPDAIAVRELYALLLVRSWQFPQATQVVRRLLQENVVDDSVMRLTYMLGSATRDWSLTIHALTIRIQKGSSDVANDWLNLGNVYNKAEVNDEAQALASYSAALRVAPSYARGGIWAKIPSNHRTKLQQTVQTR